MTKSEAAALRRAASAIRDIAVTLPLGSLIRERLMETAREAEREATR